MSTYLCQVDINEDEYQNPQELVAIWETIRAEIEQLGGAISATCAVLGAYDVHLIVDVSDGETAFQVTQAIGCHGFDTTTMRALPLDRIGELVDDI